MQADPYELNNLIGVEAFGEVTAGLRERLIRRMVEAGEDAPTIQPAPSRPSGQRSPVLPPYPPHSPTGAAHGQRTH